MIYIYILHLIVYLCLKTYIFCQRKLASSGKGHLSNVGLPAQDLMDTTTQTGRKHQMEFLNTVCD